MYRKIMYMALLCVCLNYQNVYAEESLDFVEKVPDIVEPIEEDLGIIEPLEEDPIVEVEPDSIFIPESTVESIPNTESLQNPPVSSTYYREGPSVEYDNAIYRDYHIPFEEEVIIDHQLNPGEEVVVEEGQEGTERVYYINQLEHDRRRIFEPKKRTIRMGPNESEDMIVWDSKSLAYHDDTSESIEVIPTLLSSVFGITSLLIAWFFNRKGVQSNV